MFASGAARGRIAVETAASKARISAMVAATSATEAAKSTAGRGCYTAESERGWHDSGRVDDATTIIGLHTSRGWAALGSGS